jgi:hypothetical protein
MPHEIANEATVPEDVLGTCPVRDTRGLHNRSVGAHVVDQANESVVQNAERVAENGV